MRKALKSKKGMTLVEVLVSIAILGIIAIPFTGMFMQSMKLSSDSEKKIVAIQIASSYLESLKHENKRPKDSGPLDPGITTGLDTVTENSFKYYVRWNTNAGWNNRSGEQYLDHMQVIKIQIYEDQVETKLITELIGTKTVD